MKKILVLHGVNFNMFGKRDPAHYGTITLDEINRKLVELGKELGCMVETFQTNVEGIIGGKDAVLRKELSVIRRRCAVSMMGNDRGVSS